MKECSRQYSETESKSGMSIISSCAGNRPSPSFSPITTTSTWPLSRLSIYLLFVSYGPVHPVQHASRLCSGKNLFSGGRRRGGNLTSDARWSIIRILRRSWHPRHLLEFCLLSSQPVFFSFSFVLTASKARVLFLLDRR